MNWLNTNQGLAQWLNFLAISATAYFAYRIGKKQNEISELSFKLNLEPHIFLEIKEKSKNIYGEIGADPSNSCKWEVLIKNASPSRYIRLRSYEFSDGPSYNLGKGVVIAAGEGGYPIPMLGKDVKKETLYKILKIEFYGDLEKSYKAEYKLIYNEDMNSWYWYKI